MNSIDRYDMCDLVCSIQELIKIVALECHFTFS